MFTIDNPDGWTISNLREMGGCVVPSDGPYQFALLPDAIQLTAGDEVEWSAGPVNTEVYVNGVLRVSIPAHALMKDAKNAGR